MAKNRSTRGRAFFDNEALSKLCSSNLRDNLTRLVLAEYDFFLPAPVLAEWLYQETNPWKISQVKELVTVVACTQQHGERAAALLAETLGDRCKHCGMRRRPSTVDALLVAMADSPGDLVLTCDTGDIGPLAAKSGRHVRVWSVRSPGAWSELPPLEGHSG